MAVENKKINTGIITQVRTTSKRLPGKVMKLIKGKTLLQYHTDRLANSGHEIIIATTSNNSDDCIQDYAHENNIEIHRGSEENVLSRFYEAAIRFNLGIIVRVTSDCPFIDPGLIRDSVEKYIHYDNPNLYMSNVIERTYARGFDFEIFSIQSLTDAFQNAKMSSDIEHVTPYIRLNKSGKTEFYNISQKVNNSRFRVTVDTVEDFDLAKQLIEKYEAEKLSYSEIEDLLIRHPELVNINAHIAQKDF